MSWRVGLAAQAEADLRGIYEYIAYELSAPQSAARLLDRLERAILPLDTLPLRFRRYDSEPWRSRNVHIMTVSDFAVLYVAEQETLSVTVIRVMYGGRDIDRHLKDMLD